MDESDLGGDDATNKNGDNRVLHEDETERIKLDTNDLKMDTELMANTIIETETDTANAVLPAWMTEEFSDPSPLEGNRKWMLKHLCEESALSPSANRQGMARAIEAAVYQEFRTHSTDWDPVSSLCPHLGHSW